MVLQMNIVMNLNDSLELVTVLTNVTCISTGRSTIYCPRDRQTLVMSEFFQHVFKLFDLFYLLALLELQVTFYSVNVGT